MSNALQHHSGSPPDASVETVRVRAEECQRIVEEAITGVMSGPEFLERLKGVGATTEEARDYIDQYSQCRRDREAAGTADEGTVADKQSQLILVTEFWRLAQTSSGFKNHSNMYNRA